MTSLMDAALAYAAKGIPVFPCKNTPENEATHKTPLTKSGFKDATTDPKQIERWWSRRPDALIGMPTGKASGFDVLDLDAKKGKNGLDQVPDWESLTPTIAATQNGGAHLYFKADGVTCSADKIAPGVDTRGDGGYVIIPPSPGYRWLKGGII
jgi:putative DNA primase/helicase